MPPKDEKPSLFKQLFSFFGQLSQETNTKIDIRSTVMHIRINGTGHTVDTTRGLDEALRQLATQAGIPLDQVLQIVNSSKVVHSLGQTTQSSLTEQLNRHVTMTVCSKCHRKIPEAARCLYCGQVLQSSVAPQKTANEVDKKFLETDVAEENKAKEKQVLRDTFKDRLKNL
jgi:predicted RecB family endonuclease